MSQTLSIIIPCLNEGRSVEKMVYNITNTIEQDDYEIIVVNSGGTETTEIKKLSMVSIYDVTRQGAPQARNFGATKASGNILIFADAHIEFKPGWDFKITTAIDNNKMSLITPCITILGNENSRGCGFKWANLAMQIYWLPDQLAHIHEIPFACSCCLAIQSKAFEEIGHFDSGIRLWGEEDSELSMRAWLMGYRVLCDPSVRVGHMFRKSHPYKIELTDILYNKIRFAFSHFNTERMTKCLRTISDTPQFRNILLMVIEQGAMDRRMDLFRKRIHNDDWFFTKFPMNGWTC